MSIRILFRFVSKVYSILIWLTLLAAFMLPQTARGQGLEVGGGWSHVTGDFGTDGFNVGAGWWFTKKHGLSFYRLADLCVVAVPIGLGLGRIGNFINGELYGRPTNVPWAVVFPQGGPVPRHPSQLYEAFLEGVVLFAVLLWLSERVQTEGVMFWTFVGGYGLARFVVEFFREPDPQLGFVVGPFSMGQILSLAMILTAALFLLLRRSADSIG